MTLIRSIDRRLHRNLDMLARPVVLSATGAMLLGLATTPIAHAGIVTISHDSFDQVMLDDANFSLMVTEFGSIHTTHSSVITMSDSMLGSISNMGMIMSDEASALELENDVQIKGDITNQGTLRGDIGISMRSLEMSGSITNKSGGVIEGDSWAMWMKWSAIIDGEIINEGTILGSIHMLAYMPDEETGTKFINTGTIDFGSATNSMLSGDFAHNGGVLMCELTNQTPFTGTNPALFVDAEGEIDGGNLEVSIGKGLSVGPDDAWTVIETGSGLNGAFANATEGKVLGVVGDYELTLRYHDSYVNIVTEPKPACPGDFDGTGTINGGDLGVLLNNWGACGTGPCPTDLNYDGVTNGADLGRFISNWGNCSG